MKKLVLSIALVLCLTTPSMAYDSTESFTADVELRVDTFGRAVLLVDRSDMGQPGRVDYAAIYQATIPLPPWPTIVATNVRVTHGIDDVVRRVEVAPGPSSPFAILLERDELTPIAEEVVDFSGTKAIFTNGYALVLVDGIRLWPDSDQLTEQELEARGYPTFAEAETDHIQIVRFETAGNPAGCTSGGRGSKSCSTKCSGSIFGLSIGEDCSTSCGPGHYACCGCTGMFDAFGYCQCVFSVTLQSELEGGCGCAGDPLCDCL